VRQGVAGYRDFLNLLTTLPLAPPFSRSPDTQHFHPLGESFHMHRCGGARTPVMLLGICRCRIEGRRTGIEDNWICVLRVLQMPVPVDALHGDDHDRLLPVIG